MRKKKMQQRKSDKQLFTKWQKERGVSAARNQRKLNWGEALLMQSDFWQRSQRRRENWKKKSYPSEKRKLDLAKTNNNDIRDFKIHYGGLLLRLVWPWGTRLTTPFPLQTLNKLRFRCTETRFSASTCLNKNGYLRLYSTFIRQRLDQWQWFPLCRSYISQNLDLPLGCF